MKNGYSCKSSFFIIQSNSPMGAIGLKDLFTVRKKKKKQKRNFCEAHPPTAGQCFAMAASSLESSAFSLVSLGTICKK